MYFVEQINVLIALLTFITDQATSNPVLVYRIFFSCFCNNRRKLSACVDIVLL